MASPFWCANSFSAHPLCSIIISIMVDITHNHTHAPINRGEDTHTDNELRRVDVLIYYIYSKRKILSLASPPHRIIKVKKKRETMK